MVWNYVSGAMKLPEGLRADLDRMIELERRSGRGDPEGDAKLWAKHLAEADRKRARYQEAFAADEFRREHTNPSGRGCSEDSSAALSHH